MTTTSARKRHKPPIEPDALTDAAIAALAADNAARAMAALEAWCLDTAPEGYYFDELAAARAVAFFPRYLRHTRGRWAGSPFVLLPWQETGHRLAFGWKRPDGTRRFRTVYERIPRKNGKTGKAAGVGLYLTFADNEPGAEVYSFATDTDQAAIAHDEAKRMRAQSDALRCRSMVYKKAIVLPRTSSSYKVLSSTAGTKHGLNASGLIGDEIHALAARELYDVLHTSEGARAQPLEWLITTSGFDRHSFCGRLDDYAEKVLAGIVQDAEFLPILFGAGKDDDYTDPRVWARANPSLGVTVSVDYIRKEAEKAKAMPAYENAFKRLHLNVWTEQHTRWMPMDRWDACATPVDPEDLVGRECYGGLDLSRKIDISAGPLVFPPLAEGEPWKVINHFWVPEDNIHERVKRDRVPYDVWVRQGLIKATPGSSVDYDMIRADLNALAEKYVIREIGFDEWNATQLSNQLMSDGFSMVIIRQGGKTLNEPMQFLEGIVRDQKLAHGGNPVLRWMVSNVAVRMDANENIAPSKDKSTERIDGVTAMLNALSRAIFAIKDESVPMVYAV